MEKGHHPISSQVPLACLSYLSNHVQNSRRHATISLGAAFNGCVSMEVTEEEFRRLLVLGTAATLNCEGISDAVAL